MKEKSSLSELAFIFLKLGLISFGGPAAHIALMEDEFVRRRAWLSSEKFLDFIAATNLIPGPNSTEMAIHIGYLRHGIAGLVVAGACFILPATIIVLILSLFYLQYGSLPAVLSAFFYIKPVMIAIILQALWRLGQAALKSPFTKLAALVCGAAYFFGVNEIVLIFGAGFLGILKESVFSKKENGFPAFFLLPVAAGTAAVEAQITISKIFFIFLKIGSVLFGSGYVLLAFLRTEFIERRSWLTESQLLDAVAIGQATPGPVFTTATFIGTLLAGPQGGLVATLGIFLPAFLFVALTAPFVTKLRRSSFFSAFLDGANAASLALMAVVTLFLARSSLVDAVTVIIAVVSLILILRFKISSLWLIAGAALIGLFISFA